MSRFLVPMQLISSRLKAVPGTRSVSSLLRSSHHSRCSYRAYSSDVDLNKTSTLPNSTSEKEPQYVIPKTMRAIQIKGDKGPASAMYIGTADMPEIKLDHVLVKIKAIGVNRMDTLQRTGNYPVPPDASPIMGVEFSGEIVSSRSSSWKPGQQVFGLAYGGAYAEYIAVSGGTLIEKPDYMSHVKAAGVMETYLTAYDALKKTGKFERGQSVLIHTGAGAVGIAANQLAKSLGAHEVFTTAGSEEKLQALSEMKSAPDHRINYRTEQFDEIILRQTKNTGVNLVIDFVGKDFFEKNINSLAKEGRMICLGFLSGSKATLSLAKLLFKKLSIHGTTLRSRPKDYMNALVASFKDTCLDKFATGDLDVVVHKELDWNKVQEAHEILENNQNIGKVVLTIPESTEEAVKTPAE
ncbi:quinone oxidoreductase [Phaffia rhodozyma]|uniref:Quinone oxidoreductase n=1 Tax=Phaffia rhodozyma TaxID=264483 RepID=A0A0F7STW2_PHARH|nr:quinone oxidoreductase [Phaffia rhodozyma]